MHGRQEGTKRRRTSGAPESVARAKAAGARTLVEVFVSPLWGERATGRLGEPGECCEHRGALQVQNGGQRNWRRKKEQMFLLTLSSTFSFVLLFKVPALHLLIDIQLPNDNFRDVSGSISWSEMTVMGRFVIASFPICHRGTAPTLRSSLNLLESPLGRP